MGDKKQMNNYHHYYKTIKKLGKGGYGEVYKCIKSDGKEMAMKKLKLDKYGVTSIMELSIMNSIKHPHIMNASEILIDNNTIYIYMDLAIDDLYHHIKKLKVLPLSHFGPDIIKSWFHKLVDSLYCLHSENIIHCDIKGNNILLFSNNDIKLCDFSLAMKNYSNKKLDHCVCTTTHRAPEIFAKSGWDKSIDIWSLGCTLYEITYGKLLFPYQSTNTNEDNQKMFDCIKSLFGMNTEKREFIQHSTIHLTPVVGYEKEQNMINDLIFKMLKYDPSERITLREVIEHPFMQGIKINKYQKIILKDVQLPDADINLLEQVVDTYMNKLPDIEEKVTIKRLAKKIYQHYTKNTIIVKNYIILACIYIASKLHNFRLKIEDNICNNIISIERGILKELNFHILF